MTLHIQAANVGSADITMLFSFINNRISTFASKISIVSIFFHDNKFDFFLNLLAFSKFVKIREFYEFLKFVEFAFSIYVHAYMRKITSK